MLIKNAVVYMKSTLFTNSYVQKYLMVYSYGFEIQGFNLKKENDKKNWRNELFAVSPMLVVQF